MAAPRDKPSPSPSGPAGSTAGRTSGTCATPGANGDAEGRWIAAAVEDLRRRSKDTLRERLHRVRVALIIAAQAGLAASLAWVAAHELLGNPEPVFAPIAAVGTLAASLGQRLRRTVELILGVTMGVLVGDAIVHLLGTGPWQLGLIVTLAMVVTVFLGGSVAVVTQAAATAVLIATLSPTVQNLEFPRFVDATVGGGTALLVTALLLPLNPIRALNRAARPALEMLAEQLASAAGALTDRDAVRAQLALDRLRANHDEMAALNEAVDGVKETGTLSPAHWHRRGELSRYADVAVPIDRAMRNSGTLIRRAVTLIEDEEPVPPSMCSAVYRLSEAVHLLRHEFSSRAEPEASRERSLRAVSEAGRAYSQGVGLSGSVVVAQVRTTASELIVASGVEQAEANRLVRSAFGQHDRPSGGHDDQPADASDQAEPGGPGDRSRQPPPSA